MVKYIIAQCVHHVYTKEKKSNPRLQIGINLDTGKRKNVISAGLNLNFQDKQTSITLTVTKITPIGLI